MIQMIDRLAFQIIGSLHKLFGFAYSRNTEHFVYQLTMDTAVNYAVGTTIVDSVRISQEADFVCTRVNVNVRALANNDATLPGGLISSPVMNPVAGSIQDVPCTIAFTDGSTDRALQNEPVDAHLVYGMTGGLPGIWTKPRLFARNSNVSVTLVNLRAATDAADSLRYKIAFIGWKIYDNTSLDLTTRRP
jgi:hypothetical protein